ncbi:MAG: HNH endonuclease [Lachnospiraceae bacterium]|nr:HNH endonuclease [Lachnospiraceae bacterium]
MELSDTGLRLMEEDRFGIMEKHHIVFRSRGGCDYDINIIRLPSAFHKGRNGPHNNKNTDLVLKCEMERQLWEAFPRSHYSIGAVIRTLQPWNKKSRQKIENQIKKNNVCTSKGYKREDIVRTLMGGKLYG